MTEEYTKNQIIRKDARGCFVKSLCDYFGAGKMHLVFAAYDVNLPSGQRQTNNIHIFIGVDELQEICRKISCGGTAVYGKAAKTVRGLQQFPDGMAWRHLGREAGKERAEPDRREKPVQNRKAAGWQEIRVSLYRRQWTGGAECPGTDRAKVRQEPGEPCVSQYDMGFFE